MPGIRLPSSQTTLPEMPCWPVNLAVAVQANMNVDIAARDRKYFMSYGWFYLEK
jgi:hypothetical protein